MMRRTRLLSLFLVGVIMAAVVAGCGGAPKAEPPKQETPKQEAPKPKAVYELPKAGEARELPAPAKPGKQYTIGVLLPHLANPHFIAQAYGYYDEAEKLGAKVVLFEAGGYANLDRQIKQMEDLIAQKVNAICLVAVNLEGTKPVVDQAAAAGIPVINVNVMTSNDKVVTRIRSEDLQIGKLEAEWLGKALNGKGNILMLNGVAGTSWAIGRSKGFKDYMAANHPNIRILTERWHDNSPQAGMKEMEDALQTYPKIDAVYTPGELVALGASRAIKAAKKSGIKIVTVDPSPDCVTAIKNGEISMVVVQSSVEMGRWGIRAAVTAADGKAGDLNKQYWTPLHVIDSSNVNTFKVEGVARPPEGWKLP